MKKSNKTILGILLGLCVLGGSVYGISEYNKTIDDKIVIDDLSDSELEKYVLNIAEKTDEDYFIDVEDSTLESVEQFMSTYYEAMNSYGKNDVDKFINEFMSTNYSESVDVEGVLKTLEDYRNGNKGYLFKGEIMYVKEDKKEDDIYVGVREWSEITNNNDSTTNSQKTGGVYILKRQGDGYVIDFLLDSEESFTVNETVGADD